MQFSGNHSLMVPLGLELCQRRLQLQRSKELQTVRVPPSIGPARAQVYSLGEAVSTTKAKHQHATSLPPQAHYFAVEAGTLRSARASLKLLTLDLGANGQEQAIRTR